MNVNETKESTGFTEDIYRTRCFSNPRKRVVVIRKYGNIGTAGLLGFVRATGAATVVGHSDPQRYAGPPVQPSQQGPLRGPFQKEPKGSIGSTAVTTCAARLVGIPALKSLNLSSTSHSSKSPIECPICTKILLTRYSFKQHILTVHPDVDLNTVYQPKTRGRPKSDHVCDICKKSFTSSSSVTRHVRRWHIPNGPAKKQNKKFELLKECPGDVSSISTCDICGKSFSSLSSLSRHIHRWHNKDDHDSYQRERGISTGLKKRNNKNRPTSAERSINIRMKCPVCRDVITASSGKIKPLMSDLIKHLNRVHNHNISYEQKKFESEAEFNVWLSHIERDTPCTFVKTSRKFSCSKCTTYYSCSRSTTRQYSMLEYTQRKRCLKGQGSSKIGVTCPAHIVFARGLLTGSQHHVRYVAQHLCHTDRIEQLGHVRLSKEDRKWFAEKVALKIPVDAILREARMSLDGHIQRRHIVTRSDLRNIRLPFIVAKPESERADDAINFDGLLREYGTAESSPIILYKRRGATNADVFLDDLNVNNYLVSDFMFAFMDKTQCEMLKRFGAGDHSVVFINSTHGNKATDFYLTTVSVLDRDGQGFPVAFLYSDRDAEMVLEIFVASIKARSGIIVPNSFLSNMTSSAYNAWQRVMGICNNILYCLSSVDKAIGEKVRLYFGLNTELIQRVFRQLRSLIDEPDIEKFEAGTRSLMYVLHGDASTSKFALFFEATYVSCTSSWAYCYRAHSGINVDLAFEKMQRILSQVYHKIKNKRLDIAVRTLIQRIFFDRLRSMCKGSYSKKLAPLRRRHELSLELDVMCAELVANDEWLVQSEDVTHELYVVKRSKTSCPCDLQCRACSACVHNFSCTCSDSAVDSNMCKHIHLVCTKFVSTTIAHAPHEDFNVYQELAIADDCEVEVPGGCEVEVPGDCEVEVPGDCEVEVPNDNVEENQNRLITEVIGDASCDVTCTQISELRNISVSENTDFLRDSARQLALDIADILRTAQDGDLIVSVIESLNAVRSKLAGKQGVLV